MKIELDLTPAQIDLLREGIDELPLSKYSTLVATLLPQLPLESVAGPDTGADSAPAPLESREMAGGFRITAYTPRGVSMVDALERALGKIPHGGSL